VNSFSDLSQRVRTHVCYAHVFGDALTEEQLVARCAPADPEAVRAELRRMEKEQSLTRDGDYWFLSGSAVAGFASIRRPREHAALRVLEDQRRLIDFLKRLGIVRMLAVSGSVGWRNHVEQQGRPADLDLFVITAPSSVHIVRFLLRVRESVRWLLSRFGRDRGWASVCANYVTEIEFLDVTNPSFYTASDAINVQVLKGEDVYNRFLGANQWIERYYPIPTVAPEPRSSRAHPLRSALNVVCFVTMGAYSWAKARLTGIPFGYSFSFRFDRPNSLKRSAPHGGGYQPIVAKRFRDIHTRSFGPDASLFAFLFPGTTDAGVYTNGGYAEPRTSPTLGYDE
jgi:hypothetical protein